LSTKTYTAEDTANVKPTVHDAYEWHNRVQLAQRHSTKSPILRPFSSDHSNIINNNVSRPLRIFQDWTPAIQHDRHFPETRRRDLDLPEDGFGEAYETLRNWQDGLIGWV